MSIFLCSCQYLPIFVVWYEIDLLSCSPNTTCHTAGIFCFGYKAISWPFSRLKIFRKRRGEIYTVTEGRLVSSRAKPLKESVYYNSLNIFSFFLNDEWVQATLESRFSSQRESLRAAEIERTLGGDWANRCSEAKSFWDPSVRWAICLLGCYYVILWTM